jgi:hypothetical protein
MLVADKTIDITATSLSSNVQRSALISCFLRIHLESFKFFSFVKMSLRVQFDKDAVVAVNSHRSLSIHSVRRADDVRLAELGYRPEFKREFSVCCICPL